MEPWKDRALLYELYVRKRMNLKDICAYFEKNYGKKISTQGLYNWVKKYDLLVYRGKGRKLGANMQGNQKMKRGPGQRPQDAQAKRMKERSAAMKAAKRSPKR